MSGRLEALLTLAATAVAIAFFVGIQHWPRESLANPIPSFVTAAAQNLTASKAPLLGPSVLAGLKPAPDLNLALPDSLALVVRRTGINGETGLIPTAASITTFRLRASGDLLSVAAPTGIDPVRPAAGDPDPAYRVRGYYAVVSNARGNTLVRWTENGITYEVSSRSLDAATLVELANKLR
ncbi:MAG: hypothetical protein M3R54_10745 [Chloroflexota bacterium]|nr:hypothetical protein [Chloroflexota bacterium]